MELKPHNENRPARLIDTDSVLDVGAGIRPMQWFTAATHVCLEPHKPYINVLVENGRTVLNLPARPGLAHYLSLNRHFESVFFLDCLHTMKKDDGITALKLAEKIATRQIVVREDHKFREDSEDHWNLGGEFWQTHRSHWTPDDFPGWHIENSGKGYFAIKDIP